MTRSAQASEGTANDHQDAVLASFDGFSTVHLFTFGGLDASFGWLNSEFAARSDVPAE